MARGRHDLTTEFAQEQVSAAEAVFGDAFAAPPLDCPPMQQVVGPQAKRTVQRTVRRVLHDPVHKIPDHQARNDPALVAVNANVCWNSSSDAIGKPLRLDQST